jgi:hypothetical protein
LGLAREKGEKAGALQEVKSGWQNAQEPNK